MKPPQRNFLNDYGGAISRKDRTITIPPTDAGNVRFIFDLEKFQKALKDLSRYGVTEEFKVNGINPSLNGLTVQEILALKGHVNAIFSEPHPILYHGTSKSRWDNFISKEGLQPGKCNQAYYDLVDGYSNGNVYLGIYPEVAEFYGRRQAAKDGDENFVIIKVKVPDTAKILPDDTVVKWTIELGRKINDCELAKAIKEGIKAVGSVSYRGPIRASFLKVACIRSA